MTTFFKRRSVIINIESISFILFYLFIVLSVNFFVGPFSFEKHYFSDLGATTVNGKNNFFSSFFFLVALIFGSTFCLIFWICFWKLLIFNINISKTHKLMVKIGTIAGIISSPLLIGFGLFPINLYQDIHHIIGFIFFMLFPVAIIVFIFFVSDKIINIYFYRRYLIFLYSFFIVSLIISISVFLFRNDSNVINLTANSLFVLPFLKIVIYVLEKKNNLFKYLGLFMNSIYFGLIMGIELILIIAISVPMTIETLFILTSFFWIIIQGIIVFEIKIDEIPILKNFTKFYNPKFFKKILFRPE